LHYVCTQKEKQANDKFLSIVENILLNGTQLILNQVFKVVGLDTINVAYYTKSIKQMQLHSSQEFLLTSLKRQEQFLPIEKSH